MIENCNDKENEMLWSSCKQCNAWNAIWNEPPASYWMETINILGKSYIALLAIRCCTSSMNRVDKNNAVDKWNLCNSLQNMTTKMKYAGNSKYAQRSRHSWGEWWKKMFASRSTMHIQLLSENNRAPAQCKVSNSPFLFQRPQKISYPKH